MKKGKASIGETLPDPVYGNKIITKFISSLICDGKKSTAIIIPYGVLGAIGRKGGEKKGVDIFNDAIKNIKPLLEVKSHRMGGAVYRVPVEVCLARQQALAIRWIISFARKRSERTIIEKLTGELMGAADSKGISFKEKGDTYKMAKANKAFAYYRW